MKWATLCRQHFQIRFIDFKRHILIKTPMKVISKGSIDKKSALVQVMAWGQIGDTPLPWSMLTQFTDTYTRQQASMSWTPLSGPFKFQCFLKPWWRHQMETFSALLALCAGNSLVTGEFPVQRSVTRSFGVFFDLHLNKRLSKQSWGWWFETPSRSIWRHCNVFQDDVMTWRHFLHYWTWQDDKFKLTSSFNKLTSSFKD